MPWSPEEADRHMTGLSDAQKLAWAKIANSALGQYGDEGRAIATANAQVKRVHKRAQRVYVESFSKAVEAGYADERAHKIAWAAMDEVIFKHPGHGDQSIHDPTKKGRGRSEGQSLAPPPRHRDMADMATQGVALPALLERANKAAQSARSRGEEPIGFITLSDGRVIPVFEGSPPQLKNAMRPVREQDDRSKVSRGASLARFGGGAAVGAGLATLASAGNPRIGRAVMRGVGRLAKSDADFVVEFSKIDEDKRQVFGWALVAKDAEGNDVIDLQGDMVSPEEMEKAAYNYVIHSRDGGEMHVRKGVSRMVESFVVTPEKLEQMGIVAKGTSAGVPIGWWIGFEVTDPDVWEGVKKRRYTSFSVHGMGKRKVIGKRSDYITKRLHDELGRAVAAGQDDLVDAIAKVLVSRG